MIVTYGGRKVKASQVLNRKQSSPLKPPTRRESVAPFADQHLAEAKEYWATRRAPFSK
jgi:hypothetical protein